MNNVVSRKKKASCEEIAYLAYFAVMLGARAAGLYEGMLLYNISLIIGMGLFVLKVVMTEHTVFEYLVMVILLGISVLVYYNTGEKGLLLYMTMMLGMKGIYFRRLKKWALFILATCFTVTILLAVTGIKQDISYPADGRAFFGAMMRRCLGYPYFNTMFTTYIILIVLIMLVARFDNVKQIVVSSVLLYVFAIYFYIFTGSNTGIIVTTFYLFMNFVMFVIRDKIVSVGRKAIELVYPFCLLLSILGPLFITGEAFNILDKIFHNRFKYANYYLTNEPITLFGVRLAPGLNDNYMIDSSFLYSFLQLGVIPCIILTALMMGMIHHLVVNNMKRELAVVISFCLLGMSDPFFFNLSYKNLMFLFVGKWFYEKLDNVQGEYLEKFSSKIEKAEKGTGIGELLARKIQFVKFGSKEVEIPVWILTCQSKVENFFKKLVSDKGVIKLTAFVISFALIFVLAFIVTDSSVIVDRVDMPDEWEYVRSLLTFSILTSSFGVLCYNGLSEKFCKDF